MNKKTTSNSIYPIVFRGKQPGTSTTVEGPLAIHYNAVAKCRIYQIDGRVVDPTTIVALDLLNSFAGMIGTAELALDAAAASASERGCHTDRLIRCESSCRRSIGGKRHCRWEAVTVRVSDADLAAIGEGERCGWGEIVTALKHDLIDARKENKHLRRTLRLAAARMSSGIPCERCVGKVSCNVGDGKSCRTRIVEVLLQQTKKAELNGNG